MARNVDGAPHHDRPLLALLIRLGAMAALATMSALIKLAGQHGVHLAEIMFWRQATTIPLLLGWACHDRRHRAVEDRTARARICYARSTALSA